MKFRSAAIVCLMYLNEIDFLDKCVDLLDINKTPFWVNRYAALFCLGTLKKNKNILDIVRISMDDNHEIVRAKAKHLSQNLI